MKIIRDVVPGICHKMERGRQMNFDDEKLSLNGNMLRKYLLRLKRPFLSGVRPYQRTAAAILFLFYVALHIPVIASADETSRTAPIKTAKPVKSKPAVVFISCCQPKGFFWPQVDAFMRAAAEDLDIELEVQYAEMNHLRMVEMATRVIHRPQPPDYLVVDNYKNMAEPIIKEAEKTGINLFLMGNGFLPPQAGRMGVPRDRFKHWLGKLTADNYDAGFRLAEILIQQVKKAGVKAQDGKFQIVALSGDSATPAGLERVRGLKAAVANHPDVALRQVVDGQWQEANARRLTPRILRRYPEVTAIWAANDEMGLGALKEARALGRTPGKDIFIAGINWKREALERLKSGEFVDSIGGHFMMGGWALVLLHDHYHGRDFADQALQLHIPMYPMGRKGVQRYLDLFGDEDWSKIDFTVFSRVRHPEISRYDFSSDKLFSAARSATRAGRK